MANTSYYEGLRNERWLHTWLSIWRSILSRGAGHLLSVSLVVTIFLTAQTDVLSTKSQPSRLQINTCHEVRCTLYLFILHTDLYHSSQTSSHHHRQQNYDHQTSLYEHSTTKPSSQLLTTQARQSIPNGPTNLTLYETRHERAEDIAVGQRDESSNERIEMELDKWNAEWERMKK